MKQVHWGISAMLVATLATSCVKENALPQNLKSQINSSTTIPVEQAVESLKGFLMRHNQSTKVNEGFSILDVEVVSSQNITRANGESLPAVDSLLYLVNFGNDSGYAILSADERIGAPIIAVNQKSPAKLIARGGRIPAPMHSLKN